MKKIYSVFLFLLLPFSLFAQAPQSFKYQAVLRDATGTVVQNESIAIIISIIEGAIDGNEVFTETHSSSTNNFGLFTISVGSINTEDFNTIDWSSGPYFININVNGNELGTTQLLSVPFALFSQNAFQIKLNGQSEGDLLYFKTGQWINLPKGTTGQVIGINSDGYPQWYSLFNLPTATADTVKAVSSGKWKLEGTVNPGLLLTSVRFELDADESFSDPIIETVPDIIGGQHYQISAVIDPLANASWYLRVYASNELGNVYSNIYEFDTYCTTCRLNTYEDGVLINSAQEDTYCGTQIDSLLAISPETIGNTTTVWECDIIK